MKIAFSITCHEEFSCVLDQIVNFDFFTKEAIFIIHVNLLSEDLFQELSKFDFSKLNLKSASVFINPERFDTGKACFTLHKAHLASLKFIRNRNIYFDYFVLEASNSLFIRHGVEEHIGKYSVGLTRGEYDKFWKDRMLSHESVSLFCSNRISKDFNLREHKLKSIHEGTFYHESIVDEVFFHVNELDLLCDERNDPPDYPTEELWFSLGLYILEMKKKLTNTNSLTYLPWNRNLNWSVEQVAAAIDGVDIPSGKFLIKRIERKAEDTVRVYIRKVYGY